MMPKSRDAFRTISEVADWLETPAHVLRFWESKFTQVKPVKRAGGRRYYRPADMELLGGIKKLLHDDGMTIKGVQKVLREQGVRHVSSLAVQAADADDPVSNDLIEDAPYAEVPLNDTEGEVVAFPSEALAPQAEAPSAPQPDAREAEAEDPVAMSNPPLDTDLPEAEQDDVQPDAEPEDDIAPEGTMIPDPVSDFETAEHADPEQADDIAAMEPTTDDEGTPADAPPESDSVEPTSVPFSEDAPEIPVERDESEPDTGPETMLPETMVPESGADHDAPSELPFDRTPIPATVDDSPKVTVASDSVPAAASPAGNPLDLPDFNAAPAPPPPAAPTVRSAIGPLGQIARISTLTATQKAALSAQIPALEALRDRLSAPLS